MQILFFWFGAGFCTLGLFLLSKETDIRRKCDTLPGTLLGFSAGKSMKSDTPMFRPVIQFQNKDGNSYLIESPTTSSWPLGQQQQRMSVLVERNNLERAYIKSSALYWIGAILLAMGAGLIYLFLQIFSFNRFNVIVALGVTGFLGYRLIQGGRKLWISDPKQRAEKKQKMLENFGKVVPFSNWSEINWCSEESVQAAHRRAFRNNRIAKFIFSLLFIGLGLGSYFWAKTRHEFLLRAQPAPGIVINLESHRSDRTTMYTPIVEFQLPQGQKIQFKHNVSTSHPSFHVGENVDVLYNPNQPAKAMIDSGPILNYLGPMIVGLVGLLFGWLALTSKIMMSAAYRHPFPQAEQRNKAS